MASVFRFPAMREDLRVPSVLSFPFPFRAPSFFDCAFFGPSLALAFLTLLCWSFFLPVLALGFCALAGASSLSSLGEGLSDFSLSFFSDFFLADDFGCGAPFLGSFLDPDSFS